jgi:phosphatidylserine/phosphatidylglycerophosphate/cardiolipin synthase-like enzyme
MASLLIFLVAGQIVLSVVALGGDPQSLFTDNILSSGPATNVTAMEQVLLDNINAATSTIDLAIYYFNRESVRDALITAANRGAMVRVVTDDDAYSNPSYTPHFTALETAGITVVNDSRSSIMHNKFIVIDQEIVWAGSTNITDNGFTYNHNNAAVLTSPLLADIYTIEFNEMFQQGLFGTAKSDNVTHTVDYNGVPIEIYFSPTDNPMPEVINEVNAAAEDIYFSIFFFTDDELRDALIAKVNQGLTVEGIWDALGASNHYSQDEALCAAGIPIKIEDFGGKMHNKFMIIDAGGSSHTTITGSMNWTGAGGNANDENTLIIHDAEVARAYLAAYQELYEALGPETLCIAGGNGDVFVYLPLVAKPLPPTATPTAPATPSPTPTVTPSATPPTVPPPTGDVQITDIFYDGIVPRVESDEYAEITNLGGQSVNLAGWRLNAGDPGQDFLFPSFNLAPGQSCRVYTNEIHSDHCGFSYGSGRALWNNGGECGHLYNASGTEVSTHCY